MEKWSGQSGGAQCRAQMLKSEIDANSGTDYGENHAIMHWSVACASSLINKFSTGADGETARGRCRGRQFNTQLPELFTLRESPPAHLKTATCAKHTDYRD